MCFPRASMTVTWSPTRLRALTRPVAVRAAVISRPPIQRCSEAAVRKMVSPSGVADQALRGGDKAHLDEDRSEFVGDLRQREPAQGDQHVQGLPLPHAVELAEREQSLAAAFE